jgi:DNA modification methylase
MIRKELEHLAISIDEIHTHPSNVRQGDVGAICESLKAHGQYRAIVFQKSTGRILAGNHTWKAAKALGWTQIAATPVVCDDQQALRILLADNKANDLATYDEPELVELLKQLADTDEGLLGTLFDEDELDSLIADQSHFELPSDVDDVPDNVPVVSKLGDVWLLGDHRVMCGDSTDVKNVGKLMNGKTAQLLHADPPYGMGKENDGVLNDNLYASKLDEFQMAWWKTCRKFLDDNASAYIWGNPEDLWRLWYVGGLKASERLTFRNEIVWDKSHGQGMGSDTFRSYPITTERCLLFMLGEQGFNNNADNYWEGYEPVRTYLLSQRELMKWNNTKVANFFGFHPRMADHWFSKSQWSFPQKEQYERLQKESNGNAFKREYDNLKREYDNLKREFYSTRAHFDNAHENMTEVWNFNRVSGAERYDHATPKPVEMMCRVFKSSAPKDSITLEPFGGSGSTLIAAQETNRVAYLMELDPHYVDVICARYQKHTGNQPVLEATGEAHDFTPDAD